MTRICFRFVRKEQLKHISHLDMMRLFQRALRRSGLPLAFSEGYNPHIRFNLAAPLPVNVTAEEEFGEVFLTEKTDPKNFLGTLARQLPEGVELAGAFVEDEHAPALPSRVVAALYRASLIILDESETVDYELYREALERLLSKEEILAPRARKKGKKQTYVNVRPYIIEAYMNNQESEYPLELNLLLQTGSQGGVAPGFVLEQLEHELGEDRPSQANWKLHRVRLYRDVNGSLEPLSEGM